jgi:hypothetical protein
MTNFHSERRFSDYSVPVDYESDIFNINSGYPEKFC